MDKNLKKIERKFKDVQLQSEEDKKILNKTQQEYESDQIKCRLLRRQKYSALIGRN